MGPMSSSDNSNDLVSRLQAGERARLMFTYFDDDATGVRLAEINCY
jgi:hypothetical protein